VIARLCALVVVLWLPCASTAPLERRIRREVCAARVLERLRAKSDRQATGAVDDERRHSEICRRVAGIYLGRDLAMPPASRAALLPAYKGAPDVLRGTLQVLGQCAVNETTAAAFLEQALAGTTAPLARGALRELLRDEVDHARIGWAHLTSVVAQAGVSEALAAWLPRMLAVNLAGWRVARAARPDAALRAHGCPTLTEIDTAVVDAMRALILPGFARAGVSTAAAERWLAASVRPLTEG
jgi:hypothetical protein